MQNEISYKFKVINITTNLVCLTRNQSTYEWTDEYCKLDSVEEIYNCNCSILAPTTIVNDFKYLYYGDKSKILYLPNILPLIYGV